MLNKLRDKEDLYENFKDDLLFIRNGISRIFRESDYIGEAVKKVMSDIDDYH